MGYGSESKEGQVVPDGVGTIVLSVIADNLRLFRIMGPVTVTRIGILITGALSVTALVLDFDKRITPGSDIGRVDQGVGRITAPAAAQAIGVVLYKDVAVDLSAGDEVSVQVVTAATGGPGVPFLEYIPRAEVPANQSDMVASS